MESRVIARIIDISVSDRGLSVLCCLISGTIEIGAVLSVYDRFREHLCDCTVTSVEKVESSPRDGLDTMTPPMHRLVLRGVTAGELDTDFLLTRRARPGEVFVEGGNFTMGSNHFGSQPWCVVGCQWNSRRRNPR